MDGNVGFFSSLFLPSTTYNSHKQTPIPPSLQHTLKLNRIKWLRPLAGTVAISWISTSLYVESTTIWMINYFKLYLFHFLNNFRRNQQVDLYLCYSQVSKSINFYRQEIDHYMYMYFIFRNYHYIILASKYNYTIHRSCNDSSL